MSEMPSARVTGTAIRLGRSPWTEPLSKPWDAPDATWLKGMSSKPRWRLTCGGWPARLIRRGSSSGSRNPKDYWPATKMPNFRFSWEESEAAAAYLLSSSAPYQRAPVSRQWEFRNRETTGRIDRLSGMPSDQRHRQCLRARSKPGGGKVNADWLFAWVKIPRSICPPRRCLTYASAMSRPPTSPPT